MTSGEPTVGENLRQARDSMGLSISDVSSLLHISDEYVHALENDNFEDLPAPIYVKGYIRNYAKLVQIEGEELVQGYMQLTQGSGDLARGSEELVSLSPELPKGLELRWIGFGVLILVLVIVFVTFSTQNNENGSLSVEFNPAVEKQPTSTGGALGKETPDIKSVSGNLREGEVPAQEKSLSSEGDKQPQNDSPSVEGSSDTDNVDTTSDAPQPAEPPSLSPDKAIDQPVQGTDTLFMFFNGECWVSVKDAHDFEIYAALKKAGDSLELTGVAPFRVLLGDAAVVNLDFNGKTIKLERFTRKDSGTAVVRLKPEPKVEIPF